MVTPETVVMCTHCAWMVEAAPWLHAAESSGLLLCLDLSKYMLSGTAALMLLLFS